MTDRHIALYANASSKGQDTRGQEPELRRWADAQRSDQIRLRVVWYRDTSNGRGRDRPGMARLLAAVEAGLVSTVVVWRLDRLGRTAKDLSALLDDLTRREVNLVSLYEGIDLSTPTGRMTAKVIATIARYEAEVRAERARDGQARAKARGGRLGRRPGIRTRIKVTPEQERAIQRLKAEGQGVSAIARAVGLSRPTIYSILQGQP
jgi:DNA invertase Pin-like site-specific DNA recombinase